MLIGYSMNKENVIVALLVVMVVIVAIQTVQLLGIQATGKVTATNTANQGFSSYDEMMQAHHGDSSSSSAGGGMVGGC